MNHNHNNKQSNDVFIPKLDVSNDKKLQKVEEQREKILDKYKIYRNKFIAHITTMDKNHIPFTSIEDIREILNVFASLYNKIDGSDIYPIDLMIDSSGVIEKCCTNFIKDLSKERYNE